MDKNKQGKTGVLLEDLDSRTHLKNTFGRDTGQSSAGASPSTGSGSRAKSRESEDEGVSGYSESEATPRSAEIGRIPVGCGYFLVPLRCGFVAVAMATASSPRLADTRKSLATWLEATFEMGSGSKFYYRV